MSPPCASPCETQTQSETDEVRDVEPPRDASSLLACVPRTGPTALSISIGPKLTTLTGEDVSPRLVRHGAVELAVSQAHAANANAAAVARVVRAAARQVVEHARLERLVAPTGPVVGSEGMAKAVITFGALGRCSATIDQLRAATDTFAESWVISTKEGRASIGIQYMMVGAAVLGAILEQLSVSEIFLEAGSTGSDGRRS